MKKVILLTALFLIALGFLLKKGITDDQIQPSSLESETQDMEAAFTVIVTEGNVYYGDGNRYTIINQEQVELPNNTFVKTEDGTAQIILKDNSVISLDTFTAIQIIEEENSTKLKQLYGNTWNRIKDITKLGEFKIETNNTIAAVRGTIFGVNVEKDDSTSVYVIDSNVDITKGVKTEEGWKIIEQNNLEKDDNAYIVNSELIPIDKTLVTDEFKESEWYLENREIDNSIYTISNRKELIKYLISFSGLGKNTGIIIPSNAPQKNVLGETTEYFGAVSGDDTDATKEENNTDSSTQSSTTDTSNSDSSNTDTSNDTSSNDSTNSEGESSRETPNLGGGNDKESGLSLPDATR